MATNPVASVILPYRNSEHTIDRCIKSIINQSFTDWELVAIDDHSIDNSTLKLKRFSLMDNRIKLFQNDGEGIVDALNQGISIAKSDIIIRMDSDDEMLPARINEQIEYLRRNQDVGLIASSVKYITERNSSFCGKGYSLYVDWSNQILDFRKIQLHQFEESPFAHPSVCFRKELVVEHGGYQHGIFPEDYELWLRWLSKGVRMEKLKACLLNWYDSENRLSRTGERYSQQAFQGIKAKYLTIWIENQKFENRNIRVWGMGKVARRQIKYLLNEGLTIDGYYEVDPRKIGKFYNGKKIVEIKEISRMRNEFILVLTGSRKAKEKIKEFLCSKNLTIGRDFIFLV